VTDALPTQLDHPFSKELSVALEIARRAGELVTSHFRNPRSHEKAHLDVVTIADTASEKLIADELRMAFPYDGILGEEGSCTESRSGHQWYIDPLDGTFNFSRGLPFWCVSMGLVSHGKRVSGVVFEPLRDEMFSALNGAGAWLNGQPVTASGIADPMAAAVQLSINFHRDVIDHSVADFNAVARNVMRVRNLGALALELAYLAAGRLDAVAQRGSHPWDYAAGALIAEEAGAVVSNLDGSDFDLFTNDALAAATPALHTALCRMINSG